MLGGLNVLPNLSYLDVEVLALEGCEAVCFDIIGIGIKYPKLSFVTPSQV